MKILICPDKFKECLSASKVASQIRKGIMKALPDAECKEIPMADGGEGTVEALIAANRGKIERIRVFDPLMRSIESFYGISGDGKTAFVEMAAASGMALLKPGERDPLITSSFGTGELIRHALGKGCQEIIIGIGGSATVDGGVGMARALGIKFLDASGIETGEGGGNIEKIGQIDISTLDSRIRECKIYAASDVSNVLAGPDGAAYVFGPQKGADPAKVRILDDNLQHLSKKILDTLHIDVGSLVGGGAAGGMGAGIVAFLGGALKNGFQLIADVVKLEEWIRWSDLVITGEGKMDSQTAFGKTPAGVARMSALQNKPVISFAGSLDEKSEKLKNLGFSAIVPIADRPISLQQSLNEAGRLLEDASERTFRLIVLGKGL